MTALLSAALTREAAAAVSVGTYSAWESTATLRLLGGARGAWAPTREERGGAYCVATRTACLQLRFDCDLTWIRVRYDFKAVQRHDFG